MKYKHFIPHVNREDLTLKAVNSVSNLWEVTHIIDNTEDDRICLKDFLYKNTGFEFNILKPPVSLTTAQTYNWMRKIAIEQNLDFIMFMHNDCEILEQDGDISLLNKSIELYSEDNKIGAVTICHDLFCSYSTKMLKDVGEWDYLCMPFYHLDIDFGLRFDKRGWKSFNIKMPFLHHNNASSTIKSNKLRGFVNEYYFVMSESLKNIKWNKYSGDWNNLP
jgi:hypothetical protein